MRRQESPTSAEVVVFYVFFACQNFESKYVEDIRRSVSVWAQPAQPGSSMLRGMQVHCLGHHLQDGPVEQGPCSGLAPELRWSVICTTQFQHRHFRVLQWYWGNVWKCKVCFMKFVLIPVPWRPCKSSGKVLLSHCCNLCSSFWKRQPWSKFSTCRGK